MSLAWMAAAVLAFAAAYSTVIYPILVIALAAVRPRPWREADVDHAVVHIITVHNEENRIARKLDNALSLEPPPGGLRTVVADDGSDDATASIVARYRSRGVGWVDGPRAGKERAQIEAVRSASEPILVFSDASTWLEPDAIAQIVRPFADVGVAAVSGWDRLSGETGTGEDLYVRYEMALRRAESRAGSLVGLSGCFFACRREIAQQLQPDVPSDMGAALIALRSGRRAVAQERARCSYTAARRVGQEFSRKRRTALRGMNCLRAYPGAMSWRRPVPTWQLVSHKWMRFASPWFAVVGATAFAWASIADGMTATTAAVTIGVAGACGLGSLALVSPALRRFGPLRSLGFAVVSAAAVLAAWTDFVSGRKHVTWSPTRRTGAGR